MIYIVKFNDGIGYNEITEVFNDFTEFGKSKYNLYIDYVLTNKYTISRINGDELMVNDIIYQCPKKEFSFEDYAIEEYKISLRDDKINQILK